MANSAWGIDLGNRALKAVKLVREDDRVRIEDFEVIEHEQILSQAGDNRESLLQTALANFVERHDAKGSVVAVSVSGQQSFSRFIKLPPVEPKKIPEIVKFEAIQQIPFPLDDVEWSYQLFQDPESPDVEVGIFAMKKDLVNKHIGYFTNLKLNVQAVQTHPLAVYNAMAYDGRIDQTVMFMDTGAENTDLIIADGQTVWLRTLPIGGNTFTETLAKSFRLNFQKAEELKRNAATSKYAKQIFQAMRPVFADLVAEIQRSIGFYASVHRDARIQRIVAQGGTFQLPGLQKYLQQNLQLPVEKLDAFRAAPPTDAKVAANLSENLICLAGAYGLALQALGQATITSSLLPEQIRRAKMWKEKAKWFQAAAALFVLGTVGIGGRAYWEHNLYNSNSDTRRASREILAQAKGYAEQWQRDVADKGEQDHARIRNIRSIGEFRDVVPSIVDDVLKSAPKNDMDKFAADKKAGKKREDREQLMITSMQVNYWGTDITQPLKAQRKELEQYTMPKGGMSASGMPTPMANPAMNARLSLWAGRRGPVAPPPPTPTDTTAADTSSQKRGFVVVVKGVTPHKDGSGLIERTLIQKLEAMNKEAAIKEKKRYYIEKAIVISCGQRQVPGAAMGGMGGAQAVTVTDEDPFAGDTPMGTAQIQAVEVPAQANTPTMTPAGPGPGAYIRSRRPGGGAPAWMYSDRGGGGMRPMLPQPGPAGVAPGTGESKEVVDPTRDRFFPDETIVKDWEFTALVMVVMDPEAQQQEQATTGQ